MSTFLITGVTGFLGSALANELLDSGFNVIGIGRNDNTKGLEKHKNFTYIKGPISDTSLLNLGGLSVNGVFHLASKQPGKVGLTYDDYYVDNVLSTITLLNYFKDRPLDFFVYTSTISVFGKKIDGPIDETATPEPTNYYGLTKYTSEKILSIESRELNGKIIVLRLQSIFGKNDGYGIIHTFYEQFKNNQDIELYSKGAINRNLVLLNDAVDVLKSIIHQYAHLNKFEIFHVASANSLSTFDIASIIKEYVASKAKIICSNKKYIYDWDVYINLAKAQEKLQFRPRSLQDAINLYLKQKSNEL